MHATDISIIETLQQALRSLRHNTPDCQFDPRSAAMSDIRTGYVDGLPVRRLVLTLRSSGCEWVGRGGGCIMCGHHAGTLRRKPPTADDFITQFENELSQYSLDGIEIISIYNSGSVLNPNEMPPAALEFILEKIAAIGRVKKVVLETRAEYAERERVRKYAGILGTGCRLSIAIGLESCDDEHRNLCLNKGVSLETIAGTVKSIKEFAEIQLYVFLGIPFLTENEVLEDAVATLRCAAAMGADEIHIEPATLQRFTLLKELAEKGLYRLPSLYTLYEVLHRVLPEIRPYVSPFMHMPLPERIPEGCPRCTDRLIVGLLEDYNRSRSSDDLDFGDCACQADWRLSLEESDERSLSQRVNEALAVLAESAV